MLKEALTRVIPLLLCDHREMKLFILELKSGAAPQLVIYIPFDIILSCRGETTNSLLFAF